MKKYSHVMVDLETLGVVADAVIMSIGAVKFDLETGDIDDAGFYASISIESNTEVKRRIQEDTLIWWIKQSAEAREVFTEPKDTLRNALVALSDWIGNGQYEMWSNGADFDLPMLNHAYTQHVIEIPWGPWSSNCMRTYKKLPGAAAFRPAFVGVKHHALSDAIHQVNTLHAIHAGLFLPAAPAVTSKMKAKAK